MAVATNQQHPQNQLVLVEEKFFPLSLERSAGMLREAIEHAIGLELVELSRGMWTAERSMDGGRYQEITVRALPAEDGTTVEVRIEDRWRASRVALAGTLLMFGAMLILPLFFIIAKTQETQRKLARERLVQMHRIWTEVTATVGAPTRAGYRERPERIRTRAPELEDDEGDVLAVPSRRERSREAE